MPLYIYKLTIVIFIVAAVNISCTVNTAGVTDIPNERVSGMVIYKNELMRANSSVVMRKILITSAGDSIIYEEKANPDGFGRYTFENVKNGVYVLYTSDTLTNMSAVISKLQKGNSELLNQDLFLDNNITIKGRILTDSLSVRATRVFIPGLGIHSDIDSSGYYRLQNVPNGQYDLGFVYNNTVNFLSVKTTANTDTVFIRDVQMNSSSGRVYNFFESNTDSVFSIDPLIYAQNPDWYNGNDFYAVSYYTIENNSLVEVDETGQTALLLDNFNDNDAFTELYTVFPDIIWYGWDDRGDSGTTVVIPDIVPPESFSNCIETVEGMGKAAHVKIIYGEKFEYPYAGIGCKNETTERYYINLSKMTAISFYIKGKGNVKVAFSSKKVDNYPEGDRWGDLQKVIAVPAEWQKITIPTSQLIPPMHSVQRTDKLQWADVCDSIRSVHFESTGADIYGDTLELWLDNIFLHGIGSFDLR